MNMQRQGLGELLKGSEKREKNFLKVTQSETRGGQGGGVGGVYWLYIRTVIVFLCKMQTDGLRFAATNLQ